MINFSKISNDFLIGKLLRLPLRLIPNNAVLSIIQGPLRGFRWIKGSGVNSYWLGTYEGKKQTLISTYIKQGMVCYDIGAHVGYYSLIFSKLVGESGKVFSFEPNPLNLMYLLKHLGLNRIENVFVFPVALGGNQDFVPLVLRSSESYLDKKQKGFYSPVFRVDDLISQGHIVLPDIVKIDVEGFELEVLKGMRQTLKNDSSIIFVSLDDPEKRQEVFNFFLEMGYKIYDLEEKEVALEEISCVEEIVAKKVL